MVAAAQADVVIAPGYDPGVVDRLVAKRRNTRILEAPPPDTGRSPSSPGHRRSARPGAASLRFTAIDVDGRHRASADRVRARRCRARVSHLRLREVELDRARARRRGVGHRRRPAEPSRGRTDRGAEGGGTRRRAARARATRSIRSPTASKPRPKPASLSSSSRAAPSGTRRTSQRPTSSTSRWSSPASGTSCIDVARLRALAPLAVSPMRASGGMRGGRWRERGDDAGWPGCGCGVRRSRAADREVEGERAHAGTRHSARRKRRRQRARMSA